MTLYKEIVNFYYLRFKKTEIDNYFDINFSHETIILKMNFLTH